MGGNPNYIHQEGLLAKDESFDLYSQDLAGAFADAVNMQNNGDFDLHKKPEKRPEIDVHGMFAARAKDNFSLRLIPRSVYHTVFDLVRKSRLLVIKWLAYITVLEEINSLCNFETEIRILVALVGCKVPVRYAHSYLQLLNAKEGIFVPNCGQVKLRI